LVPFFEGKISWVVDSISHVSQLGIGTMMHYTMGGMRYKNLISLSQKEERFDAAFFMR